MLSGFRSRWTMPRSCAAARPATSCSARSMVRAAASGPRSTQRAQRLALEELGDEERHGADADVEDREHVGMRQRCDRARFLLEAPPPIVIGGRRRRHDLDRDVAPEPRVARAIDLAHPAGADRRHDLVGAEAASRIEHPLSLSGGLRPADPLHALSLCSLAPFLLSLRQLGANATIERPPGYLTNWRPIKETSERSEPRERPA